MQDKYVKNCPYCGGTEVIKCYGTGYETVTASNNKWGYLLGYTLGGSTKLYHSICRKCGSVVRSYVKDPEKLLKRKDRR